MNRIMLGSLIVGLIFLLHSVVYAQTLSNKTDQTFEINSDEGSDATSQEFKEKKESFQKKKRYGFASYPIISYSPETSLTLGAGTIFTHRRNDSNPDQLPNSLHLRFMYSFKKQTSFFISPDIYFNNQQGELTVSTTYINMPTSFFGIGNTSDIDVDDIEELEEKYSQESVLMQIWLRHMVISKFYVALTYDLQHRRIFDIEEGGILAEQEIYGSEGGLISGIGPSLGWDSRDNKFYPSQGGYHRIWAWFYRDKLGSDYMYENYWLDFRSFHSLSPGHILAFQTVVSSVHGEAPFFSLQTPMIRGIYSGVFLDRKMATVQAEYRFPIKGRFSGAAFLAAGDAVDTLTDYEFNDIKYAAGGGVRFALNKEEKINIRFDIGVSPWGVYPYIMIMDSF